jgi:hypothetical protein
MRHYPGEVLFQRGSVAVRYLPSQGSTIKYRTTCQHGNGVNDRLLADARYNARHPEEWCWDCANPGLSACVSVEHNELDCVAAGLPYNKRCVYCKALDTTTQKEN